MPDDNSPELKIHIVTDADNTGFKSAATAADELSKSTEKTSDSSREFSRAIETGGESAKTSEGMVEKLGLSHHSLHKILHLIARESGPAAGAALAGIGAVAGGGLSVGVLAVSELVSWLHEAAAAAAEARAAVRDAFVEATKQSETANTSVEKLTKSINDFFTALDRKNALASVKSGFEQELQGIKAIADALVKNGLLDKDSANQFTQEKTDKARMLRAIGLDQGTDALKEQLQRLLDKKSSAESIDLDTDLEAMKKDRADLEKAFKEGKSFRPKSSARNSIGVLMDETLTDPKNEALRKADWERMDKFLGEQIKSRENNNTKLEEHIKLLQSEIDRRTSESGSLRTDISKSRQDVATEDFAKGVGIANRFSRGEKISENDAQYIVVLEQAITGHKLTLNQAVTLIGLQARNMEVATQLLGHHRDAIAAVNARLQELQRQNHSITQITK